MDFRRLLGNPEIEPDLLVQLTADQVREHLPLARAERGVPGVQLAQPASSPAILRIAIERSRHGVEQLRTVSGLHQKIDGAALHRLDGVGNIALSAQENHRQGLLDLRERALNLEAALNPGNRKSSTTQPGVRMGTVARNSVAVA